MEPPASRVHLLLLRDDKLELATNEWAQWIPVPKHSYCQIVNLLQLKLSS